MQGLADRRLDMRVIPGVVLAVVLAVGPVAAQTGLTVPLKFSPQGSDGASAVALPPSLLEQPLGLRLSDDRALPDLLVLGAGTDDDDRPFPIRSSLDVSPFVEQVVGQLADAHRIRRDSSASRQLQLRLTRFQVDENFAEQLGHFGFLGRSCKVDGFTGVVVEVPQIVAAGFEKGPERHEVAGLPSLVDDRHR